MVGYTNAGKSTLLNALTDAGVYTANQLFATLDPTTRRVKLPSGSEALFSDTVGFIQKLPTQLVVAFRATLEEIAEADALLIVVDATHHVAPEQLRVVRETLEEIGAGGKPALVALNKLDKANKEMDGQGGRRNVRFKVTQDSDDVVDILEISALRNIGLEALLARVEDLLSENLVPITVQIPYRANELVALFHQRGIVEREEFTEQGTLIEGRIAAALLPRLEVFAVRRKHRSALAKATDTVAHYKHRHDLAGRYRKPTARE